MNVKACLVCSAPVGKGRSKYCSAECSEWMHRHNIAALEAFQPEENPLPDGWMDKKTLRRRNRELHQYGRRICRTHQGAALPLTEEHFYYARKDIGQFDTECKTCVKERDRLNKMKRYHSDPKYRRIVLERAERFRLKHHDRILAQRRAMREQRRRTQLAAQLKSYGYSPIRVS